MRGWHAGLGSGPALPCFGVKLLLLVHGGQSFSDTTEVGTMALFLCRDLCLLPFLSPCPGTGATCFETSAQYTLGELLLEFLSV